MQKDYKPEFLTCAIYEWKNLLADDNIKQIILDSLAWLVQENKVTIYAFVIMPNHIHLLWRINENLERAKVQGAFFSFTAHEFLKHLKKNNPESLLPFEVNKKDRKHQFWRRNPLAKECFTPAFTKQKLEYIHMNPCQPKWKLAEMPEEYQYSSAAFYYKEDKTYPWLSHIGHL